jgi:GGDEF domain-containing protein
MHYRISKSGIAVVSTRKSFQKFKLIMRTDICFFLVNSIDFINWLLTQKKQNTFQLKESGFVVRYGGDEALSYNQFVNNADKALYLAKNTGRNRVIVDDDCLMSSV